MNILALESSCDETAAAVVRDGREVLSSIIASQADEHRLYGGGVTRQALEEASLTLADIDAVAVTYAPGLIGALLVGVNFAKGLAQAAGLPLVPVHHLRSHIAANYLAHPDLKPPFLCLVVSGGHTHIVRVEDYTAFTVLGRTRDDAAGECFDKAARAMGMPYPGGVHLDRAAQRGDPKAFALPRPQVDGSPFDFSFSGLKTAVINRRHKAEQRGETLSTDDLCASFQATVCDILCSHTLAAAEQTGDRVIALAGGVSANSGLRSQMERDCAARGIKLYVPPLPLCGDNAAMVGSQGYYEFLAGHTASTDLNACATLPIE